MKSSKQIIEVHHLSSAVTGLSLAVRIAMATSMLETRVQLSQAPLIWRKFRDLQSDSTVRSNAINSTMPDCLFHHLLGSWHEVADCFHATEMLATYLQAYAATKSLTPEQLATSRAENSRETQLIMGALSTGVGIRETTSHA